MPAGFEAGARDARCGVVEVGVGAHDVGGVGAELADEFLRAGGAGKLVAGGGAAGDGDGGDQRMGGQQLGGLTPAGDDVEEPVGDAGLLHRLRHQQRDLGAGRRRLDHDGVADRQRRRHFLNEQIGRPVERRHRGHHAVRHARGEAETAGARRGHVERQHLAHEVRHLRGARAQEHAYALRLECRGAPRLADEEDERAHDLAFDPVDRVGCGEEPLDPLGGGRVLMLEKRRMRVLDRGIDHLGVGFDHVRGDAVVGGTHERRQPGVELGRPSDPGHQLRYGHRRSLLNSCYAAGAKRFGLYPGFAWSYQAA